MGKDIISGVICCVSTGKSWHDKVKEAREKMTKKKADALVVTALDEVACKHLKHDLIIVFVANYIFVCFY